MPDNVKFDLSELVKFNKNLAKKIPIWMEKALIDYGLTLEELIVDEIDRMKLSVSGEMKKSVTHIVKERLHGWLVTIGTNVKTAGGYPYPIGVHEGTIAHWAPIAPLIEWVRRKGLAGTYSIKTHRRTGGKAKKAAQDKAVAYAIQHKISKVGTKAHPFMTNVFTKERYKIRKEIGKALLREMKGGKVV